MNIKSTNRIGMLLISSLVLQACVTSHLREGADAVVVVKSTPATCLKVDEGVITAPPIGAVLPESAKENLIVRAKNWAARHGADQITIKDNKRHGLMAVAVDAEYFACGPLASIQYEALEKSCNKLDQPDACAEIARRSQSESKHAKMLAYFQKACRLQHTPSCEWLTSYEKQKAELKRTCIERDAPSCFAAAKLADVELDHTLMMTFLKQGCSYGHSESCFYQNYVQEEKERIKDANADMYQQYMVNLQQESLRQQRIMTTMAILNSLPKSQRCVSQKQFDGTVVTNCN